ncbi:MAG: GntR family transcriptional regulator [Hyphomicrobiales bacterium]
MENDQTLAGRIARQLADRIVNGALRPGVPLRQDQIGQEFDASHVPVREAFRRLEAQGLVVSEPRRGGRVAPLDAASIMEVTEMRATLEALALRHALPRMMQEHAEAAQAAIEKGEGSEDITVWEDANRDFHRALIAPCAMPRLLAAIDDLHRSSARFLFATWRNLDWQGRSEDEHREILAAVDARDAGRATERLIRHISAAGQALIDAVQVAD